MKTLQPILLSRPEIIASACYWGTGHQQEIDRARSIVADAARTEVERTNLDFKKQRAGIWRPKRSWVESPEHGRSEETEPLKYLASSKDKSDMSDKSDASNALTESQSPTISRIGYLDRLESIHGEDYIIDYYAILGVTQDATADEIKKAWRSIMRETHPDVVARASDKIQRQAERDAKFAQQAYNVLSDPEKRIEYDQLLATFPEGLISPDGTAILNLRRRTINTNYLVSGAKLDLTEVKAQAKAMSGYNDEIFQFLKTQIETLESPPSPIIAAYMALLGQRLFYLTLLEDLSWEEAGVMKQDDTKHLVSAKAHLEQRQDQVAATREEIVDRVTKQTLALTAGGSSMLLSDSRHQVDEDQLQENPLAVAKKLSELATQRYDELSQAILDIAKDKANTLEELLKYLSWDYLTSEENLKNDLHVIIVNHEGKIIGESGNKLEGTNMTNYGIKEFTGLTLQRLQEQNIDWKVRDTSVVTLFLNSDIPDVLLQIAHVARLHFSKVLGHDIEF